MSAPADTLPQGELPLAGQPAAAASPSAPADPPLTLITPPRGWQLLNVRELWQYRELLMFLTWRDVMVRYKQTVLGAAWAILQPAMMMVVFTVFLGQMAHVDSGDFPYPVFVYAGLLPWTFFATAIANAGNSVVGSSQMVSKIYFPRLLIPLAAVAAAVVDFFIAFLLLAALMLYYGIRPGWGMLLVPLVLALAVLAATGVGALLAALNVAYRDFKYTIPFLVQIWMFATPTVYMNVEPHDPPAAETQAQAGQAGGGERAGHPRSGSGSEEQGATSSLTPDTSHLTPGPSGGEGSSQQNLPSTSGRGTRERVPGGEGAGRPVARTAVARGWVKAVLRLNPMTGLIGFFRAAVLGGPLPWARLGTSVAIILAVFVAGLTYFRRVESSFADII